jgi:hypothetical protein
MLLEIKPDSSPKMVHLYYIDCSSEFDFMTDEREREREVLGKNKK